MSVPEPPPPPGSPAPPRGWVEPPPGAPLPPPGPPPPPTPPVAPPPPVWAPLVPPAPPKRSGGPIVGLVLGGLVLLALAAGAVLVVRNGNEPDVAADSTDTVATDPPRAATTSGPTTSVAGIGAVSSVTAATAAPLVRDLQQRNYPDLTIGLTTCPPGPYRIGHVVVCRKELGDAAVLVRVEITGDQTLTSVPASPIVDTDQAEALMEEKEPGASAECGEPRVRQVQPGERITCRTATYTWDFTVGADGGLTGTTR